MALRNLVQFSGLVNQHKIDEDRKYANQLMKEQNEGRKLQIEIAKAENQFQKDEVEKKAVATDILSKELENKAKKKELLDKAEKKEDEEFEKRKKFLLENIDKIPNSLKEKIYNMIQEGKGASDEKPPLKDLLTKKTPVKQAGVLSGIQKAGEFVGDVSEDAVYLATEALKAGAGILTGKGKQQSAVERAKQNEGGFKKQTPEEKAQQIEKNPYVPKTATAPITAPPTVTQPFSLPEPISLNPSQINVPPPPIPDTKSTMEALEAQKQEIKAGIETREHIQKINEAIKSSYLEAGKQHRIRTMRNIELQRKLAENPPTYRKAVSNVGLFGQIIGIIDAGMHGHLYENPTQLLDGLIEKELADQVSKYKAGSDYLKTEQNMYGQFYQISKDEFEAESSTRAMLLKGIDQQIDAYSKLAVTDQQKATLGNLKKEVLYKHGVEIAKMQQTGQQKEFENFIKIAGIKIKQQEADTKRIKAGQTSKSDLYKIRENEVKVDGKTYYIAKPDRKAFQDGMLEIKSAKNKADEIERLSKQVKWNYVPTGVSAFFTPKGKAERAKLRTLNKLLQAGAGSMRVKLVGPGAVSLYELKVLENYMEVTKDGGWLKVVKPLGPRIWAKAKRGDYDALISVLRKSNENRKEELKTNYLPDYVSKPSKKKVDMQEFFKQKGKTK